MPRGDGTGPEGKGPMSGRGVGACGGNDVAGFGSARRGRGLRRRFGRGGGRGWRGLRGRGFFGWGEAAEGGQESSKEEGDS